MSRSAWETPIYPCEHSGATASCHWASSNRSRQVVCFSEAAPQEAEALLDHWHESAKFSSLSEHRPGAEEILRRGRQARWLTWPPTREQLERTPCPITLNRIGVVAKQKVGSLKLRLIHDLRRSGVNQKVDFNERLVLPRLTDLKDDLLWLIDTVGYDNWECVVLDFADAFKNLRVYPKRD